MTVLVPRLVTAVVCSATLSLFSTVCLITAVEATRLRWDGSFCNKDACALNAFAQSKPKSHSGAGARTL